MKPLFKALVGGFFGAVLTVGYLVHNEADAALHASGGGFIASDGSFTAPILAPNGAVGAPSYSFSSAGTSGIYWTGSVLAVSISNAQQLQVSSSGVVLPTGKIIQMDTGGTPAQITGDSTNNTVAFKNGTNAQNHRLYFSTTGPVYWLATARTAGVLYTGTGGAAQVSYAQTTVPTCTSNCGTSPSVAGTDTAGIVTMGSSGVPASGWVITFNGTWPAAPSCVVQSALAGMVVGKMPIVVATTTTTMTVTTNGTAPSTSDKYAYHCYGVS